MAINTSDAAPLKNTFSPHVMTGVDKLHAEGLNGNGIKIAVIDTGVDYTHPALGGGFGPGFKVIGGYDFVGEEFNGIDPPKPDNDVSQPSRPLNACSPY
jgi:subtilisin family serine protease